MENLHEEQSSAFDSAVNANQVISRSKILKLHATSWSMLILSIPLFWIMLYADQLEGDPGFLFIIYIPFYLLSWLFLFGSIGIFIYLIRKKSYFAIAGLILSLCFLFIIGLYIDALKTNRKIIVEYIEKDDIQIPSDFTLRSRETIELKAALKAYYIENGNFPRPQNFEALIPKYYQPDDYKKPIILPGITEIPEYNIYIWWQYSKSKEWRICVSRMAREGKYNIVVHDCENILE